MLRRIGVATLGLLAFAATSRAQGAPAAFVGCYALTGAPATTPGEAALIRLLPAVIELDTLAWEPGSWHLRPSLQEVFRRALPATPHWTNHGSTVWLTWSNGFTALTLQLTRADTVLKGTAWMFHDYNPPSADDAPRPAVRAVRQACFPDASRPAI